MRYHLKDLVHDEHEDGTMWVGALPHGPIVQVTGAGLLVMDAMLAAEGEPRDAAEITAFLRTMYEDLPVEAEGMIAEFLRELEQLGVVEQEH